MASFSAIVTALKSTLPSSINLDPAALVKVARGSSNLDAVVSTLTEYGITYVDGQLPDTARPAKYAVDLANTVGDLSTARSVAQSYSSYITQANQALESIEAQALNQLNVTQTQLSNLAIRKHLYAGEANEALTAARASITADIAAKKELLRSK